MMSPILWSCLVSAAILLTCSQAHPVPAHRTTCQEFGNNVTFDPKLAVGTWTTVYAWTETMQNFTETVNITKLTPLQHGEYQGILDNRTTCSLQLYMRVHDVTNSDIMDVDAVLDAKSDSGNVVGWLTRVILNRHNYGIVKSRHYKFTMKWKQVDGFLVVMFCQLDKVFILSKTDCFEVEKLNAVVKSLNIEGIPGGFVRPGAM